MVRRRKDTSRAPRTYVYGLGLISQIDGSGNATYLLPDGLGSNSTVTDDAGAVDKGYKYDVFGEIRSSSGSGAGTEFQFAGEQSDATLGLIYLRRAYDPAIGRFTGSDPARRLYEQPDKPEQICLYW